MFKKKIFVGFALFLGLMWVCTLVSKSIYATKLPMVRTAVMEEKYIEHRVEAEGVVVEGGKQAVTAVSGLRVEAIRVHAGDRIEEGDLLFQIDLEDLKETIKEKQTEIDKLSMQVNAILENQELARQKKEIQEARAREDYDTMARQKDTDIGRAADVYARAMEDLEDTEDLSEEDRQARQDALQSAAYQEADAMRERDKVVKDIQRNIEDLQFPEASDATLSVTQTEIAQRKEDLSIYRKLLEEQGEVKAAAAGMITDIYVDAGDRIPEGAVMMMTDDTIPCQFKVILDKDQKKYIGSGDQVTVKLDGSRKELETEAAYFSESKTIPGSFETFIDLPENMGVPGLSGTLTHSERGEKYHTCVSPQVIYSSTDINKYYIYILKEREGILGSEYYAEEVSVKILDQNEDWAAISSSELDSSSQIIVSADKEFKKGDVVRWDK